MRRATRISWRRSLRSARPPSFRRSGSTPSPPRPEPMRRRPYQHALEHGLLTIMSKMGVRRSAGYCGSALFDIVGLDSSLVRRWFQPASARTTDGATMIDIARACTRSSSQCVRRVGVSARLSGLPLVPPRWRAPCVQAGRSPAAPQSAASGSSEGLRRLRGARRRTTSDRDPRPVAWTQPTGISVDEVEPPAAICRASSASAMSVGALSPEAHDDRDGDEPAGRAAATAAKGAKNRVIASARGSGSRTSRSRRRASASRPRTCGRPTSCRSRSRRAPSRAKAASCRESRSWSTSRGCGTRSPARR